MPRGRSGFQTSALVRIKNRRTADRLGHLICTHCFFDKNQVLLDLFQSHARDGRVILPLLKATDILLAHQCLDELVESETGDFRKSLVLRLSQEAKNCNDVHRHFACIDVALGLVRPASNKKQVSRCIWI